MYVGSIPRGTARLKQQSIRRGSLGLAWTETLECQT